MNARCNRPAVWYSSVNGYMECSCCGDLPRLAGQQDNLMVRCSEMGPGPYSRCDRPKDGGVGTKRREAVWRQDWRREHEHG